MSAATGSNSVTIRVRSDGSISLESNDPWYRYLRAVADLFIAGAVGIDDVEHAAHNAQTIYDPERHGHFLRELACPAARALANSMMNVASAPDCLGGSHAEERCAHERLDRRAWLRELIG